uniref:ANF_receptor domain-containing protein n=1 Tax=Angiostrongylus cantonensis TaxID=6313 RepID=A0A0K0DDP2_ANGCA
MMFVENEKTVYSYVGYRTSASAVLIAKDRITREGLLPGIDFEFFYAFDECNERKAAGIAIAMNEDLHVDVILGPTCNSGEEPLATFLATLPSAIIAGYYNKPLFTWGLSTSSEFGDVDRFPNVGAASINSLRLDKINAKRFPLILIQILFPKKLRKWTTDHDEKSLLGYAYLAQF